MTHSTIQAQGRADRVNLQRLPRTIGKAMTLCLSDRSVLCLQVNE
jgi:hypothetical protein